MSFEGGGVGRRPFRRDADRSAECGGCGCGLHSRVQLAPVEFGPVEFGPVGFSPVGRGRRRRRPQRADRRRLPGPRRPAGARAGAARAGRRRGRVGAGAFPGSDAAAVALLLPGQPAAPAHRRRARSRRPPGPAPRLVVHAGPADRPAGCSSPTTRTRTRRSFAGDGAAATTRVGPRCTPTPAASARARVPDAHRAAAHPRRAAGAGGRRRPVDGARRAPARRSGSRSASRRPRARRGRDRRAHRHPRPPDDPRWPRTAASSTT